MCQYGMAIRGVFHSVFFSETNMCRWDALLFGEHRRINPDEGDLDKMLNTFHQRPPETAHSARKELHAKILSYAPHVQFELIPGCVAPPTFLFNPKARNHHGGCNDRVPWTRQNPNGLGRTGVIIRIAVDKIDALLNKNLNVCFLLVGT